MRRRCTFTDIQVFKNTIFLGIVACLSHFAYDLSGKRLIIGLFNPVKESVWEHLKFMYFPFLLWWIIVYYIKSEKCETSLNTWIVSAAVSLVSAPLSAVLLYYSYTGALGIESVFIDVLLTFLCYYIALCVASHFLKYSTPNKRVAIVSVVFIIIVFISFIVFTIYPPKLPIFYASSNMW